MPTGAQRPGEIIDAHLHLRDDIFVGPQGDPGAANFTRVELEKIRALGLTPEEQADVLGGSIARILGI
jgi:hypothetical protein